MIKFFILSLFIVILGILFIKPFEKEDDLAFAPAAIPMVEKKVTSINLEDVREIEQATIKYKRKKLGKRNSHRAMNSIKREEPLVMENEDIPFAPLR